jgi:hypothetical protein
MATRRRAWVKATALAALAALSCSEILSIEEAHVDPTLGANGGVTNLGGQAQGGGSPKGGEAGGGMMSGGRSGTGGVHSAGNDAGGDVGSGGLGDAGSAGAGGTGGDTLCEQYCDTITQYCTATSLQYKDRDQCLKVCSLLPQGAVGDPDGNSVACRLKYAGKARYAGGTELGAYCRQAGPGGDGRCGTNCDGFCSITAETCTVESTPPYYFQSMTACQTTCESLPSVPYIYGDVSVADGNSVQCRLFHVISAAMADPEEHCEHAMGLTLCEATE